MATNTAASFTNHTGNGTAGPFSISFSYLAESEVDVTVGGVLKTITTHYTFNSATQITFTSGNEPGNGVAIKFQRDTDISAKKVDFADGSVLTETDLDTQNDQVLFAQQEIIDKLGGIVEGATGDQTAAEIRTAVEAATDSNVFTDADHSKLNAIEASATADQTASEIRTLVESASDSNVFTDADHTKLNGIEASATADQTAAEIRTLVESATDSNVFTDADHTKVNNAVTLTDTQTLTNKTLTAPVINDLSGSGVVTSGTSTSDNKVYSAKRAGEIFYGKDTVGEIQSGETWSSADDKVATTAAIDARVIDLVDDVGGFVPIANELSFPNANPDVNNGAGTLVSIKALSTAYTSNGSGQFTIANGTIGNSTVTITGATASTTFAAGFGMILETTTTLNTYTFHRLTPKATEVTTVAGISGNITTVAGIASNVTAVAGNATNINAVNSNASNINAAVSNASNINSAVSNASNINSVVSNATNINSVATNISNVNAVAGISSNVTSVAGNASNINSAVSNASNITTVASSITNVNNVGGSISNVNTVASNISSVNSFANTYRIGSSNPTSSLDVGDLFFNTSTNSLKVYTGSAWVDGVTATGNFALKTGNTFTGDNIYNDNVKAKFGTGSDLEISHTGSFTKINNKTGDLNIFAANGSAIGLFDHTGTETLAKLIPNGAVELYHDNSKKLETTSSGIDVDGSVTANDIVTAGALLHEGDTDTLVHFSATDTIDLKTHGTERLRINNSGVSLFDTLFTNGRSISLGDSGSATDDRITFGESQDLQLFHTGVFSNINNTTGDLDISSNVTRLKNGNRTENFAAFLNNGQAEFYFDNSKKFETTSTGATVSGGIRTSGNAAISGTPHTYKYGRGVEAGGLSIYATEGAIEAVGSDASGHAASLLLRSTADGAGFVYNPTDDALELKLFTTSADDFLIHSSGTNVSSLDTQLRVVKDGAVELYHNGSKKLETTSSGITVTGSVTTQDMNMSNLNGSANEVDNTKGSWSIQEGSDDLFIINRVTGKKYKFDLTEIS